MARSIDQGEVRGDTKNADRILHQREVLLADAEGTWQGAQPVMLFGTNPKLANHIFYKVHSKAVDTFMF